MIRSELALLIWLLAMPLAALAHGGVFVMASLNL
jgi:hypothetical protein